MYEVMCLNLIENKQFSKIFYSPYLMEKFINKCKYSKKIKVTGWWKC